MVGLLSHVGWGEHGVQTDWITFANIWDLIYACIGTIRKTASACGGIQAMRRSFFFLPPFYFHLTFHFNSADLILPLSTKGNKTNCPHKVTYATAYTANPPGSQKPHHCGMTEGLVLQHVTALCCTDRTERRLSGEV